MNIKINDTYTLVSDDGRFTVTKEVVREKMDFKTRVKTGEVHTVTEELAYGLKLEHAIEYVIRVTLEDRPGVVTLKEYLQQYKSLLTEIKTLTNAEEI